MSICPTCRMYFKWIQPIPNWLFIHFIQYFNKSVKKNKKRSPSSLLSLLLFLVCLDIPKHWENEISVEKIQWKLMFFFIRWEFVPKHLLNSCEECTHTQTLTNILLKNFPQRECSTTINHFLQLPKLFFTLFQNRLHSISAQIQRQHHYPKNMKSMFL